MLGSSKLGNYASTKTKAHATFLCCQKNPHLWQDSWPQFSCSMIALHMGTHQ